MEPGPDSTDGRVLRAKALREKRRAEILVAARQVFAEKGYQKGSIADIIETAGIARGTFYVHFDSKREVFGEILDELLAEVTEAIARVEIDSEITPREQLITNVVRVLDILIEKVDVTRILLHSVGDNDPEFGQKFSEFRDHCLGLIKSSLRTGHELGLVRPIDDEIFACCVYGGVKETADRFLLRGSPSEVDRRALAEKLLDYNLSGILLED